MERQGALTTCSLMTKRQAHDEKESFTFPPCQQHSKCLPAAGTSSRNPLDYWVCVTERRSPQLTTCKEVEGDDIHQTCTWPFELALGQSSKQLNKGCEFGTSKRMNVKIFALETGTVISVLFFTEGLLCTSQFI